MKGVCKVQQEERDAVLAKHHDKTKQMVAGVVPGGLPPMPGGVLESNMDLARQLAQEEAALKKIMQGESKFLITKMVFWNTYSLLFYQGFTPGAPPMPEPTGMPSTAPNLASTGSETGRPTLKDYLDMMKANKSPGQAVQTMPKAAGKIIKTL